MLEYARGDFEVIVVDNSSTDGTSEMLANIETNYNFSTVTVNKNMGRAFARNYGVKEAKGEIIIFLDSDMIVEKNFLLKHVQEHESSNTAVCGQSWRRVYSFYYEDFKGYLKRNLMKQLLEKGNFKIASLFNKQALIEETEVINGDCFKAAFNLSKMYEAEKLILMKYGNSLSGFYFPWSMLVTNNCSIEKDIFNKVGGFDNSFIEWGCEDLDLGYRLYKNGSKFIKQNGIESIHQEHPIDFLQNGEDNVFFFTKKYDSIDLLLFYYGYLIKVDKNIANEIMIEIERADSMQLDNAIEIYRRLLVALRNKKYKFNNQDNNWFHEIKKLKYDIVSCKQELQNMLNSMKGDNEFTNFFHTFNLLILKVFNKNLENLS
jgi:GT2 family glycosyltransferase